MANSNDHSGRSARKCKLICAFIFDWCFQCPLQFWHFEKSVIFQFHSLSISHATQTHTKKKYWCIVFVLSSTTPTFSDCTCTQRNICSLDHCLFYILFFTGVGNHFLTVFPRKTKTIQPVLYHPFSFYWFDLWIHQQLRCNKTSVLQFFMGL